MTPITMLAADGSVADLFSRANHSRDFCTVRAELFRTRMRFISLAFAWLAAMWIGVDYAFLNADTFAAVAPLMGLLALLFGGVYLMAGRARWGGHRVAFFPLFYLLVLAFYVVSKSMLPGATLEESMIVGFYFAPFLLVTLLALFPMTIVEAAAYHGGVLLTYVVAGWWLGGHEGIVSVGYTWLLAMMLVMVGWTQVSQLHMLLRLYREASYDVLTGLANRRVAFKWLDHEMAQAQRSGRPLSVLLFDLDHFKKTNDLYGHLVGDEVLAAFGALLRDALGAPHITARFGGEEFFAVLPGTDRKAAAALADEIRVRCHGIEVTDEEGRPVPVSVSVGVTEYLTGEPQRALVARVDETLYRAKESGRDLVSVG